MTVRLNPEVERFVAEKVESGQYVSADAVLREALILLHQRDETERIRKAIAVGLEQLERGEGTVYDAESLRSRCEEKKGSRAAIPGDQVYEELRHRSAERRAST